MSKKEFILFLFLALTIACAKKEDDDDTTTEASTNCQFDLFTQYDLDTDDPTATFDRVQGSTTVVKKIISQSTCSDYPDGAQPNVNFLNRISRSNPGSGGDVLVFYDSDGFADQSVTFLSATDSDTHVFSNLDELTLTSNGKVLTYETKSVYVRGDYADPDYNNSIYFLQTVTVADE